LQHSVRYIVREFVATQTTGDMQLQYTCELNCDSWCTVLWCYVT